MGHRPLQPLLLERRPADGHRHHRASAISGTGYPVGGTEYVNLSMFLAFASCSRTPAAAVLLHPGEDQVAGLAGYRGVRHVNNQQNSKKILRPNLPMYFSIIIPMDFPSFLTEAYKAPKSVTAPKNTPPMRIQRSTGNQPNAAA